MGGSGIINEDSGQAVSGNIINYPRTYCTQKTCDIETSDNLLHNDVDSLAVNMERLELFQKICGENDMVKLKGGQLLVKILVTTEAEGPTKCKNQGSWKRMYKERIYRQGINEQEPIDLPKKEEKR